MTSKYSNTITPGTLLSLRRRVIVYDNSFYDNVPKCEGEHHDVRLTKQTLVFVISVTKEESSVKELFILTTLEKDVILLGYVNDTIADVDYTHVD